MQGPVVIPLFTRAVRVYIPIIFIPYGPASELRWQAGLLCGWAFGPPFCLSGLRLSGIWLVRRVELEREWTCWNASVALSPPR